MISGYPVLLLGARLRGTRALKNHPPYLVVPVADRIYGRVCPILRFCLTFVNHARLEKVHKHAKNPSTPRKMSLQRFDQSY